MLTKELRLTECYSCSIWTKLIGNIPRRSGALSNAPSIQLSSSVCSLVTIIISPSRNDSSSSLSASQSYRARHRRNPFRFDVVG